ncbi:MAG: carbon-nitrogen hydrolase family protein [Bacteroidales bacterium]
MVQTIIRSLFLLAYLGMPVNLTAQNAQNRAILPVAPSASDQQTGTNARKDPKPFKLALVQMNVVGGNRVANLQHAEEMIGQAAGEHARFILLPEAMDLGWTDPSALTQAEPVPEGMTATALASLAKKYDVYICSGLIERGEQNVYNSAILLNPEGEVILLHRKINELDIGHPYYALGDRLKVCETEYGTIGLMICADASTGDEVIPRALAHMGADVILSPSSWAVPADHNNLEDPYGDMWYRIYNHVARDFRVWIASCSNVGWMTGGPWKGWKGIGCSMVVSPGGVKIVQAPYGVAADTVLYVDIRPEPRPGQGTTWHRFWDSQDR